MKVSAKSDYAVRAAAELAAAQSDRPLKAERISEAQGIPIKFLEAILLELKHAGVVKSTRGADGGYALARPASEISIADVIRAVDGPLANVRGERPEDATTRARQRTSQNCGSPFGPRCARCWSRPAWKTSSAANSRGASAR